MGRSLIVMSLAALLLLAAARPTAAAEPAAFGDYTGAELYRRFCASCHGRAGHGDGPVADSLAVRLPDLTEIALRNRGTYPRERVMRIIDGREYLRAHGPRPMPVWGFVFWTEEGADQAARERTDAMIVRLADYLESLQRSVD